MSVKVLIVDDSEKKSKQVRELLVEAGVIGSDIEVVSTGNDARRRLSKCAYDLLVLDIAIPLREGDPIDRKGGIELLEELVERETYNLPQVIHGLTAFEDLFEQFGERFRSRLWTLDYYDSGQTGWIDRLRAKANYIVARGAQKGQRRYENDLCVIAALHSPELSALRSLPLTWAPPESLDEVNFFYRTSFISGATNRSLIAAAAPRMGIVSSALLATKVITEFRPRLLVMIGITAGVRGQCELGDVIVADPCWEWQSGKYEDGSFAIEPDQIDIPIEVRQRCVQLSDDRTFWFGIHDRYVGPKPGNVPKLRIGPVASGSAVLADATRLTDIKGQHRKLIGVEMEIYGAYAAARDSSTPRPRTFSLKSVCDFGDSKKSDDFQAYAANVSANALLGFAERYMKDFA